MILNLQVEEHASQITVLLRNCCCLGEGLLGWCSQEKEVDRKPHRETGKEQIPSFSSSLSAAPSWQSQVWKLNVVCSVPQHHGAGYRKVVWGQIGNNSIPGRYAFPAFYKYVSAYTVVGTKNRTMSKTRVLISP